MGDELKTVVLTADVPVVYANALNISVGVYDFQFNFAFQTFNSAEGTVYIKDISRIVMSPQHTKALFQLLEKNIKEYENAFGEIKLPPNAIKSIEG